MFKISCEKGCQTPEIPANVVQGAAGIVIALVAYPMVKKIVQDKLN